MRSHKERYILTHHFLLIPHISYHLGRNGHKKGGTRTILEATQDMTFDKTLMHNIKVFSVPRLVNLPNTYKVQVTCSGSIHLSSDYELHNVLFVPAVSHNLLSVYQLCHQDNCMMLFAKFGYFLRDLSVWRVRIFGEEKAGLYVLKDNTS